MIRLMQSRVRRFRIKSLLGGLKESPPLRGFPFSYFLPVGLRNVPGMEVVTSPNKERKNASPYH